MGSYRNVGNDILKEWLDFREEYIASLLVNRIRRILSILMNMTKHFK